MGRGTFLGKKYPSPFGNPGYATVWAANLTFVILRFLNSGLDLIHAIYIYTKLTISNIGPQINNFFYFYK